VRLRASVSVRGRLRPTPAVVTAKPVIAGDAARGITQRVFVPPGSRIDPQLTVALTDQSRHRTPPAGMTVRYDSDRPSVVSAGLRARHAGVATITATVAYRGGTARGTFVVAVR
jgi:beta-glucosidase